MRLFPKGKEWLITSQHVDWENTVAYLTDQSGIKNYPYGGIRIGEETIKKIDYEAIRNLIIDEFLKITDPVSGKRIVRWVCRREELYSGEYIDRYPDILFELSDDYSAGTITPAQLFDKSVSHNIVPGYHKQHHATFLISGINGRNAIKKDMTLMDVAPTILGLLGIDWQKFGFDGTNVF